MTNFEFVDKLKSALKYDTLYVNGCFGAPLRQKNKDRYISRYSYNSDPVRKNLIMGSTDDTFGFDCVCFIKGILWGWNGDKNSVYGGAEYASNNIPDTTIHNLFMNYCEEQSADFSSILPGEFVVLPYDHCGVYIGNGEVIECTPLWKDGVQITQCWNIKKTSTVGRMWNAHAKFKFIDYYSMESSIEEQIFKLTDKFIKDFVEELKKLWM